MAGFSDLTVRPVMAGSRPPGAVVATVGYGLDLGLFGHLQCVIHLDSQLADNEADETGLILGSPRFYLLAALMAVLGVPLWLVHYFGLLPLPAYVSGVAWHAHGYGHEKSA